MIPLLGGCTPTPSEVTPDTLGGSGTTGPVTNDDSTSGGETEGETDNPTVPPGAECGDGIIEGDEECDQGDANGPGQNCRENCLNNVCGDGDQGPGELCDDGNQIDDDECSNDCGPSSCGDGVVQSPEQCDEGPNNSENGNCLRSCTTATCGDPFINTAGGETCDGTNTGDTTCESLGFEGGTLECNETCDEFDTSNCFDCGNDLLEANEECDGALFDGFTCDSFAPGGTVPSGGDVACDGMCIANAGSCTYCGDDVQEGTEECDGSDFNGQDCSTFAPGGTNPSGGDVACGNDCIANAGSCTYCGDGMIEGNEDCEDGNLDGEDCVSRGYFAGSLSCDANCGFDESGCTNCGNDTIDAPETCDGTDLGGMTCDSINPAFGPDGLGCQADCGDFDLSGCCLIPGEACTMDVQCCSGDCNNGMGTCAMP